MTLHIADDIPLEVFRSRPISPTFWLWVDDILAAFGLMFFIASAWVLASVVQAAMVG